MRVLALDTSARGRTVAVVDGSAPARRVVAGTLLGGLDAVLRDLDLESLTAVVVVTGPGTYTGVRAGMAAALGIAQARSLPLHGLSSLEVAAHSAPQDTEAFLAVGDAGRGALYAQRFRRSPGGLEPLGAVHRLQTADLAAESAVARLDDATAAGALLDALPVALRRPALDVAGLTAMYVDATEGSREP